MITKKQRDNAYMSLYRAVAKYVKLNGGRVIVCGGISIQEWPNDAKHNFTIAIKCAGRKPKYAETR